MKLKQLLISTLSLLWVMASPTAAFASGVYAVDGDYSEWSDVPHTVVEYNTWDEYEDGLSAIYSTGGYCYFHIYSPMPAHLNEGGGEFTSGISVLFNDNWGTGFYPRFITVDDSGNIDWYPQLSNLSNGTYHLYVVSSDAWGTSSNISDLNDMDQIYGDAFFTIADGRDDMEWRLDLAKVAQKLNMDEDEMGTISVQYSRIGQQWTITTGTPTGTAIGITLCFITLAVPFAIRGIKACAS